MEPKRVRGEIVDGRERLIGIRVENCGLELGANLRIYPQVRNAIVVCRHARQFGLSKLTVAIAIVRKDSDVLLVHRRGSDGSDDSWQFPAGMIKPGFTANTVAVRETLAETGVHCAPVEVLGRRVHPASHVLCEYVLCEYLGGDAENRDPGENVSVAWAATSRLPLFIPPDRIFAPVRQALQLEEA